MQLGNGGDGPHYQRWRVEIAAGDDSEVGSRHRVPHHLANRPQFLPRCSAVRQASACAVSVGLCAPLVPITEAPRTPRLGASFA
jgi:hypothetical protein